MILCQIRQKKGNEAFSCVFLVFSLMKIGKANLRLKWKKWENEASLFLKTMKIGSKRV